MVDVRLFLEMEDEMAPEELERGIPPRMLRIEVSSVEEALQEGEDTMSGITLKDVLFALALP